MAVMAVVVQNELSGHFPGKKPTKDGAESLALALAHALYRDKIRTNGKPCQPQRCLIDEIGEALTGAAMVDFMHEYTACPLDDLDGLTIED